jgi:hypothetical protein
MNTDASERYTVPVINFQNQWERFAFSYSMYDIRSLAHVIINVISSDLLRQDIPVKGSKSEIWL